MLCVNVTLSTKPKVHGVSQYCQKKTEPQPQVTYNGQSVTFGHMVPEIGERMHTDALITATSLLSYTIFGLDWRTASASEPQGSKN